MEITQKCNKILSNEVKDDQISCNNIELILPYLLNQSNHFILLIQPILKNILQYWIKGQLNINNKWSNSCISLATSLSYLLIQYDNENKDNNEDYTKYYKLIGFVLGKALNMGTVRMIYSFIYSLFISLSHYIF